MSTLSNSPKDYYFCTTQTKPSQSVRFVLSEKDYWDGQGYKKNTLSWSGDALNFALMSKISEYTGLQIAEEIEGVIEVWGQGITDIKTLIAKIEEMGMVYNPSMEKAADIFLGDMCEDEEWQRR